MDHTDTEKAQVEMQLLAASWLLKDMTQLLKDITGPVSGIKAALEDKTIA